MMKILITGGCGFIGTNLIKYLDEKGCSVRIIDNLSAGNKQYLAKLSLNKAPELILDDVRNEKAVNKAAADVDAVVHLAAHTSVVESLEDPREDWDVNVNGTLNLLEACRRQGAERFILASSNAVLGEQPPPIDEEKIPQPLSPYGASKLAGEALCSTYYHSFGLKTVSLRFANCYGPYSDHKSIVTALFMRQAKAEKTLVIYGDGHQTRDFIHADDICQAIYLSLTAGNQTWGEVFQIASGTETSINQLVELISEVTGKKLQIVHEPERKGEIRRNYSDISKARAVLGFEPRVRLRQGLQSLWPGI